MTLLGLCLGASIRFWFVLTRPFCGTLHPATGDRIVIGAH